MVVFSPARGRSPSYPLVSSQMPRSPRDTQLSHGDLPQTTEDDSCWADDELSDDDDNTTLVDDDDDLDRRAAFHGNRPNLSPHPRADFDDKFEDFDSVFDISSHVRSTEALERASTPELSPSVPGHDFTFDGSDSQSSKASNPPIEEPHLSARGMMVLDVAELKRELATVGLSEDGWPLPPPGAEAKIEMAERVVLIP